MPRLAELNHLVHKNTTSNNIRWLKEPTLRQYKHVAERVIHKTVQMSTKIDLNRHGSHKY